MQPPKEKKKKVIKVAESKTPDVKELVEGIKKSKKVLFWRFKFLEFDFCLLFFRLKNDP